MDVTITIPTDPAVAALQAQIQTLTAQVQALTALDISVWKQNMVEKGELVCGQDYYYDAARVYYQIADYTGDVKWLDCAKKAIVQYRDGYLVHNNYRANGWTLFGHGLYQDYIRTQDEASKTALLQLTLSAQYASSYPLDWSLSADSSREVAYNVMAKLLAVNLGGTVWGLAEQVEQAFGHVAQWTRILAGQPSGTTATYCRPFMAGLTTEALIQWAGEDAAKRARVVAAIAPLWESIWRTCWIAGQKTMMYTDHDAEDHTGGQQPSPDLNLLIAPAYAWLYKETLDATYKSRADALFAGSAAAFIANGKHFNQNYRWSFDYLTWRQG